MGTPYEFAYDTQVFTDSQVEGLYDSSEKILSDDTAEYLNTQVNKTELEQVADVVRLPAYSLGSQEYLPSVDPTLILGYDGTSVLRSNVLNCAVPSTSYQDRGDDGPFSQSSVGSDDGIPCVEPWVGDYNFRFRMEEGPTKKYNFSTRNNKLYCVPNLEIEFRFMYDFAKCKSADMIVEGFLRYQKANAAAQPVVRCPHHEMEDRKKYEGKDNCEKDMELIRHVLKCAHPKAEHFEDEYKRCRVRVPIGKPQPGNQYVSRNFRFDCLTSCKIAGTPKDRKSPVLVVFELKERNKVVGRIQFQVRVCSCPGRDFAKDEGLSARNRDEETDRTPKRKHATSTPARVQFADEARASSSATRADEKENDEDLDTIAKQRRLSELVHSKVEAVNPQEIPVADEFDPISSSQESTFSDDGISESDQQSRKEVYRKYGRMSKEIVRLYFKTDDPVVKLLSGCFMRDIKRRYKDIISTAQYTRGLAGDRAPGGSPDSGVTVTDPPRDHGF